MGGGIVMLNSGRMEENDKEWREKKGEKEKERERERKNGKRLQLHTFKSTRALFPLFTLSVHPQRILSKNLQWHSRESERMS